MAKIISNQHYVNFLRGTPLAFEKLQEKDSDTLYFISEKDALTGKLYLGEKLISDTSSISSLESLFNISEGSLSSGQTLIYNDASGKWENKNIIDILSPILGIMSGASSEQSGTAGLTPIPEKGDENKFLKGDGTWSLYTLTEENINSVLNRVDTNLYWDNF